MPSTNWLSPNTINENVVRRNSVRRNPVYANVIPENIPEVNGYPTRPSDTSVAQGPTYNPRISGQWQADVQEGGMHPLQALATGGYQAVTSNPDPNSAMAIRQRREGSAGQVGANFMPQMPNANAARPEANALGQNIALAQRAREARALDNAQNRSERALNQLSQLNFVPDQISLNITPEWDPSFQGAAEQGVQRVGRRQRRVVGMRPAVLGDAAAAFPQRHARHVLAPLQRLPPATPAPGDSPTTRRSA